MVRGILVNFCKRLVRAVAIRLSEDVELMQSLEAGLSSAAFASASFSGAVPVRGREALLLEALKQISFDGLVCEFGVYKGHTLRIIADILPGRMAYGFDSFEGLPEGWRSGFGKGAFRVGIDNLPELPGNVKLYPGWFSATLPEMMEHDARPAAFLHVDCDLYSSTKSVLGGNVEKTSARDSYRFRRVFQLRGVAAA